MLSASKSKRSPYLYPALGVLLLVLGYFGYQFLSPNEEAKQKIASAPASLAPAATSPEAEPKAAVAEKVEPKPSPAPAAVKKAQEIAKAKEPAPEAKVKPKEPASMIAAKPKEPSPTPVAKPQETEPPVVAKEQVAVAKESASPAVAAPLSLKMNIIGQRKEGDGTYSEILVNEGSVLRSHDNFQIHLEASRPSYVTILIYDSQGKASQIFPDPKVNQSGSVEGGSKLVVPAKISGSGWTRAPGPRRSTSLLRKNRCRTSEDYWRRWNPRTMPGKSAPRRKSKKESPSCSAASAVS